MHRSVIVGPESQRYYSRRVHPKGEQDCRFVNGVYQDPG
jgi:hypothetical protein